MHKNLHFVHFLSIFDKLYSKTIVCMQILHIPNDCSANGHLTFLFWGGVQASDKQFVASDKHVHLQCD